MPSRGKSGSWFTSEDFLARTFYWPLLFLVVRFSSLSSLSLHVLKFCSLPQSRGAEFLKKFKHDVGSLFSREKIMPLAIEAQIAVGKERRKKVDSNLPFIERQHCQNEGNFLLPHRRSTTETAVHPSLELGKPGNLFPMLKAMHVVWGNLGPAARDSLPSDEMKKLICRAWKRKGRGLCFLSKNCFEI